MKKEVENIKVETNKPLSKTNVMCCAFLDWVNLNTHFFKSPHMKLWYDKSEFYGTKGFTTVEVYELFVAQHST
jgi:hypothetical protein